jgi:tetratricopeptide (TPR) repeat protein
MTRRAGHGASLDQACRHLLLHLADARKLRSNSLVAAIFTRRHDVLDPVTARRKALEDVRRIVESAAEDLRTSAQGRDAAHYYRQYQILVRCDLGGESHKQVASDLGISLRHFYRERRSARVLLAGSIERAVIQVNKQPIFVLDRFDTSFNRAHWLFELGTANESIDALRDLRSSETDPRKNVAAWTALIETLAKMGQPAVAMREWSDARSQCPSEVASRVDMVLGTVLWYAGHEGAALRQDQRSRSALRAFAQSHDRLEREFALRQCIELVRRMSWTETPAAESVIFEQAEDILQSLAEPSPILRLSLLSELLNFRAVVLGERRLVRPLLEAALQDTRKFGLQESQAACLFTLSLIEELDGRLPETIAAVREYQQLLPSVKSMSTKRMLSLRTADVDAEQEEPAASVGTARELREGLTSGSHLWAMSMILEGKVLMRSRDFAGAIPLFRTVYDSSLGNECFTAVEMGSAAMCLLARSYANLGRGREAREYVDEAIRALSTGAHQIPLQRAQEVAMAITQITK